MSTSWPKRYVETGLYQQVSIGATLRHAEGPSGPTPGELTKALSELTKGSVAESRAETATNPLVIGRQASGRSLGHRKARGPSLGHRKAARPGAPHARP